MILIFNRFNHLVCSSLVVHKVMPASQDGRSSSIPMVAGARMVVEPSRVRTTQRLTDRLRIWLGGLRSLWCTPNWPAELSSSFPMLSESQSRYQCSSRLTVHRIAALKSSWTSSRVISICGLASLSRSWIF